MPASVPPPLDAAQSLTPQPFKPTRLQPNTSASGAANRKRSRSTAGLGQKTQLSFLESFRGASQQFSVSTKSGNTITGLSKEQISGSVAVCPVQLFPCSVCGRTFARTSSLANHMRTHPQYVKPLNAGVLLTTNDSVNRAALQAETWRFCSIQAAKIIDGCLANMLDALCFYGGRGEQHWCGMKIDGRKKNRGADKRQKRTYGFKKRVILEKEMLIKLSSCHSVDDNSSQIVAMTFNLQCNQVDKWYRDRDSIRQKAAGHLNDHKAMCREKKGKFPDCERELFKAFTAARQVGKQIGPFYLRTQMLRIVRKMQPPGWRLFTAKQGWLFRFTKRWKISLRRKTNVQKKPVADRLPLIKRFFAVFRIMLLSHSKKAAFDNAWSIYKHRWSLDQVPFCIMDAKATYANQGSAFVHIASNNGSSDAKRFGTLQVLCRNKAHDATLPRGGQPRLCMCFRGKGLRISIDEQVQYHADVYVQWQKNAWYDSVTSNRYVAEFCVDEIKKSELGAGEEHLLLCDNLGSQTEKTNPQFKKLLRKLCRCEVWNLLAGCTDEVQVVDAGLGALIKRFAGEEHQRWSMDDANWEEWTGSTLTASRKRVLMTQFYGAAWARACQQYDFVKNFNQCGSNLTADGTGDKLIKLDKCGPFEVTVGDALRDSKTGRLPTPATAAVAVAPAAATPASKDGGQASESESGEDNIEELVEADSDSDDELGGDTSEDDLEGDDFECPDAEVVVGEYPESGERGLLEQRIYQRYDVGWYGAMVLRRVRASSNVNNNLKYAVKFDGERKERFLDLFKDDYGSSNHWVLVNKKE